MRCRAEWIQQIERLGPKTEYLAGVRFETAQRLAKKGPNQNAAKIWKEIIRLYPETPAAGKSQELLADWDASWKLNLAKALAEDGLNRGREDLIEKAKGRCQEIINIYPKSKAAKQASELLEKISN